MPKTIAPIRSLVPVGQWRTLTEGWFKPSNTTKTHYFREGASLCGKWLHAGPPDWSVVLALYACKDCHQRRYAKPA